MPLGTTLILQITEKSQLYSLFYLNFPNVFCSFLVNIDFLALLFLLLTNASLLFKNNPRIKKKMFFLNLFSFQLANHPCNEYLNSAQQTLHVYSRKVLFPVLLFLSFFHSFFVLTFVIDFFFSLFLHILYIIFNFHTSMLIKVFQILIQYRQNLFVKTVYFL